MTERTSPHLAPLRLTANSALSLIGKGGSLASNSIILFLVAYWLGAAEAGVYSLAIKYTTLVLGFAMLGLDSFYIRDVAQDPRQARNYVVNFSILRLLVAVLAYGCLALFVSSVPGYAPHTVRTVVIFAFSLIPESLYRLYQSALITLNGYDEVARLGVLRAALALPLGIGALLLGASLEIVVLLQVAVVCLVLLLTLVPLRARIRATALSYGAESVQRLNIKRAIHWFRATLSFAVIDGLFTLEWQLDVIILSFFVDERRVGIYAVAQAILSILMLLLYSADTVIFPLISRVVVRGRLEAKRVYLRLVAIIAAGIIPLAILIVLSLGVLIPRILGEEFRSVLVPLNWLIVAWTIQFLNAPGARLIISVGQQRYIAALLVLSVGCNIVLSLLFIPPFGIRGPAMARTASAAVYALSCTGIVYWLLNRQREMWKTA